MNKKALLVSVLAVAISHQTLASKQHSGFSVGLNLGQTSVDGKLSRAFNNPVPIADSGSNFGDRSTVFGLFLGYGWLPNTSGLYLGGEVFGQIENLNATRNDRSGLNLVDTTKLRSKNVLGAVAKLGYSCKEMLFFGKLGIATRKWDFKYESSASRQSGSINSRKTGFLIGLGMDYAISQNLAIGAEYIYTAYGSLKFSAPANAALGAGSVDINYKPKVSTINLRLKYTF